MIPIISILLLRNHSFSKPLCPVDRGIVITEETIHHQDKNISSQDLFIYVKSLVQHQFYQELWECVYPILPLFIQVDPNLA